VSEVLAQDYIRKLSQLEKQIGTWTKYRIMNPFNIDPSDNVDLQRAARNIAQFIGLNDLTFIITVKSLKGDRAGQIDLVHNEKEVYIEISDDILDFDNAVLTTIAHEITHKFMHRHKISCYSQNRYENEILTDITAVFIGLGKLMMNGCEVKRKYSRTGGDSQTYTKSITTGYLNMEQLAYVYRMVCTMRKIPKTTMIHGLAPNAIIALERCYIYWRSHFNDKYYSSIFIDECKDDVDQRIKSLSNELKQTHRHIEHIKDVYISKSESFVESKQKSISEIRQTIQGAVPGDIYDPCLQYLRNIDFNSSVQQMCKQLSNSIADVKEMNHMLNNITALIPLESVREEKPQRVKKRRLWKGFKTEL